MWKVCKEFIKAWNEVFPKLVASIEKDHHKWATASLPATRQFWHLQALVLVYNDMIKQLVKSGFSGQVLPTDELEMSDKSYVKHLRPLVKDAFLDWYSPDWRAGLVGYFDEEIERLGKVWSGSYWELKEAGAPAHDYMAVFYAKSKLKWVKRLCTEGVVFPMPLPTQSFIKDLYNKVQDVGDGIHWVSCRGFRVQVRVVQLARARSCGGGHATSPADRACRVRVSRRV